MKKTPSQIKIRVSQSGHNPVTYYYFSLKHIIFKGEIVDNFLWDRVIFIRDGVFLEKLRPGWYTYPEEDEVCEQ